MANDSTTTVLSVVAWGTKLTFGLYDYAVAQAAKVGGASQDISRLAKEVNLLSQVLRQIGSRLKEDGSLPSPEAFNVVRAILSQCQDIFREIETLIPVGQQQISMLGTSDATANGSPQSRPASLDQWRKREQEMDWNIVVQARAQYLLAHLEALKLTMSVMLQTLYTAKAIVWARYDNHQTAYEAVVVEKLQTESLVIEQQLALLRAYRLHENFRWQTANAPLQLEQSSQSLALVKRDSEYGPSPRALVPYQEPSLVPLRPSASELDDLPRIRMISSPYVDYLLSQWTRMHVVEERLRVDKARPREERRSERYQRRNWQAPAVESDSEADDIDLNDRRRPPKLQLTTNEPVLMHVNESPFVSSPVSAVPRSASLQPPGGPFSPQPSNSWGPTSGSYFPQNSNTARRRVSPGPSPLASPRVSFSSDTAPNLPPRVQTAFKADQQPPPPPLQIDARTPVPHTQSSNQAHPLKNAIPYRLRINQWYWDYADATLLDSNVTMTPQEAIKKVSKDTQAITEIFQAHVSREAIRKEGLDYTRVMRERIVGGQGPGGGAPGGKQVEDQCYCIEGALRPEDVKKLVERTRKIRGEAPPSPRPILKSAVAAGLVPPLDRSNTAPVYGNKFRETHQREVEAVTAPSSKSRREDSLRSNASNSTTSDSDTNSHSHSSRPRSKSRHRHDSPRSAYDYDRDDDYHRRNRSRTGEKEKRKSGSGSGKMQTATKIAAGAGLATLLDGLPEMLAYL